MSNVWVSGHERIYGNEEANKQVRHDTSDFLQMQQNFSADRKKIFYVCMQFCSRIVFFMK